MKSAQGVSLPQEKPKSEPSGTQRAPVSDETLAFLRKRYSEERVAKIPGPDHGPVLPRWRHRKAPCRCCAPGCGVDSPQSEYLRKSHRGGAAGPAESARTVGSVFALAGGFASVISGRLASASTSSLLAYGLWDLWERIEELYGLLKEWLWGFYSGNNGSAARQGWRALRQSAEQGA